MKFNEAAAKLHEYTCLHSQMWDEVSKRYGRECDASSSAIEAWKTALAPTKYARSLDNATWTGNMRKEFKASKLFDVVEPALENAVLGDLFLNEEYNVVMYQGNNKISGFVMNEVSGRYEGWIGDYYDGLWDCLLHYNGKLEE